jgi:hypothetical protein
MHFQRGDRLSAARVQMRAMRSSEAVTMRVPSGEIGVAAQGISQRGLTVTARTMQRSGEGNGSGRGTK